MDRGKLNHSRPLGLMEKYQISKQLANVYGTLLLSARVQLDTSLPFNNNNGEVDCPVDIVQFLFKRLKPVILQLCKEIPLLSLTIQDIDTPTPRFNYLNQLQYSDIVRVSIGEFFNDTKLARYLEEEIGLDFDLTSKSRPLWRLHIYVHPSIPNEIYIICPVHHVICDGLSTMIVLNRLIELLNYGGVLEVDLDGQNGLIDLGALYEMETLLEPFNTRTPHHPTIRDLIPIILKHKLLPSFISKYFEVGFWAGQHKAELGDRHNTMVRIFEIPKEKFQVLLSKCKTEHTTPHAAIHTSTILSTIEALGQDSLSLKTCTPISTRSHCVPEASLSEVGNFVGAFERVKSYSKESLTLEQFWESCREYKSSMTADTINSVKTVNLLQYVGEFPSKWIDFWNQKNTSNPMGRSTSYEISDIGRWEPKQQQGSKWKVITSTYAQSANVYGSAFNINLVSINGSCRATCTWQKGCMDEDTVDSIVQNILSNLDKCIDW